MTSPSPSTLGCALLGLLAREPLTGYELSRRMKSPIGFFWTASHSQVYPELGRLQEARLVVGEVVPGPGPRDNKRYRITAAGRGALAEWAVSEAPDPVERDEFLLRVYSLWLADRERATAMIQERMSRHRATLAEYRRRERATLAQHDGEPAPDHPDFGSWATLRRGSSYERHALAWCRWLLERLRTPQR